MVSILYTDSVLTSCVVFKYFLIPICVSCHLKKLPEVYRTAAAAMAKRIFSPVQKFLALKRNPVQTASITPIRLQSSASVSHQSKPAQPAQPANRPIPKISNALKNLHPHWGSKLFTPPMTKNLTDEETKLYIKEPKDIHRK